MSIAVTTSWGTDVVAFAHIRDICPINLANPADP
jgi:hypothetical protein